MRRLTLLLWTTCAVLVLVNGAPAAEDKVENKAGSVKLKHDTEKEQIAVLVNGEEFTVFHLGDNWPKPFASPVRGPGGTIVTRPIAMPGVKIDHPHHKGIWVAIDEVNEIKFWAEQGKIKNVSAIVLNADGNPAQLKLVNHWQGNDGKPLLEETTLISIHPNRMMAYDITFKAVGGPVTFEDTKEGLFGIRLIDSLREKETGKVLDSEGRAGSKAAWGKTADWMDYYGTVDDQTFGAALFDHPDNFRPSRYHVRDYGLFTISPFGEQSYAKNPAQPLKLEQGETHRLRYGVYVHAGDTKSANVAKVYQDYVQKTK